MTNAECGPLMGLRTCAELAPFIAPPATDPAAHQPTVHQEDTDA
jgi:hypothetical protein